MNKQNFYKHRDYEAVADKQQIKIASTKLTPLVI